MKKFEAKILKLKTEGVATENNRSNEEPGSGMDWASAVAGTLQNSAGTKTASVNVGRINVLERLVLDQSNRERRSKNVLIFGVKKSDKIKF